jgi:hypothetical protein
MKEDGEFDSATYMMAHVSERLSSMSDRSQQKKGDKEQCSPFPRHARPTSKEQKDTREARLSYVWCTNGPLSSAPHAFPETLNGKDASERTWARSP